MTTIEKIYASKWWEQAMSYPDRHYPKDSGVMLSDHLSSVMNNSDRIFKTESENSSYEQLHFYLLETGYDLARCQQILQIVSLLHDIGKPHDNKEEEIEHPIKKTIVKKRHQVLGVYAAIDILNGQSDFSDSEKQIIYNLIDEHDTPFSWYRQFERTKVIPDFKSWKRLDNKISSDRTDNYGIIMLALFKLADIDGHDNIVDATWFIEQLNEKYLNSLGKPMPTITEADLR